LDTVVKRQLPRFARRSALDWFLRGPVVAYTIDATPGRYGQLLGKSTFVVGS
jgi:hypothetical protein